MIQARRKITMLLAALAVVLGAGLVTAPTASAAGSCLGHTSWDSSDDSGGRDAIASIYDCDTHLNKYGVKFTAYGEILELNDRYTDGHKAEAVVKVQRWNPAEGGFWQTLDTDRFTTGTTARYNLGTPDGSGNIAEGLRVRVELSHTGSSSKTVTTIGRA